MKKVLIPKIKYVFYELAAPTQLSCGKWVIRTQAYPTKALTANLEIEVGFPLFHLPIWEDKFFFDDALEAILAAHEYYDRHGYSKEDYPWVYYVCEVITLEHYHEICSRDNGTVENRGKTVEQEVMDF